MESILIVYKSKTGFTKKYVDWITESIECQAVPIEQISQVDINDYDMIIYGAGIRAGQIQGLKEFREIAENLIDNKKKIVFATGGAPYREEIVARIRKDNFSDNELNDVEFFYFQSGINYEKMGLFDKSILKMYSGILKLKKNKSEMEDGTSQTISESYDYSSSDHIKPLIDSLNQNGIRRA